MRSKSPLDKAYTNKPSSYNKNPNSKEIDEEEAIAYQEFLETCPSSERVDEATFRLAGVLRDKIEPLRKDRNLCPKLKEKLQMFYKELCFIVHANNWNPHSHGTNVYAAKEGVKVRLSAAF